jgi:hypothetical protein
MVAKEKAKELVEKYLKKIGPYHAETKTKELAKQSALICVDVILNDVGAKDWELDTGTNTNYWQEVKQEINKLW